MPVALIAGGIAAAGAVGGALISSSATKKASQAASDASAQNDARATQIYQENKGILSPYVQQGYSANNAIGALTGIGGTPGDKAAYQAAFDNYQKSTGYEFRTSEGMKALSSRLAGSGVLNSGAAQKSALQYGQGIASAEFGNYLAALQGQQQVGLSAGNALAGVGTNYSNATAANNNAAASNIGNAALAGASNTNNLIGGLAGIAGNTIGALSSYGQRNSYGIAGVGGIY